MAKVKKNTAKKGSSAKKSTAKKTLNDNMIMPEPVMPPIRRELWALVFLFLAVFLVISNFNTDGRFVKAFAEYVKGFVGWGFWITVPAFLMCSLILGFHHGRPVTVRVVCSLLVPVLVSALGSLLVFSVPEGMREPSQLAGHLFSTGLDMDSAGVFGGLLAVGLEKAFSVYGAFPLLAVALVFCAVKSLNGSFKGLVSKTAKRMTVKYDPSMYSRGRDGFDDEEEDYFEPVVIKKPKPITPDRKHSRIEKLDRDTLAPVDIPLGEDEDELPLRDKAKTKRRKAEAEAQPKPNASVKSISVGKAAAPTHKSSADDELDAESLGNTVDELMKPINVSIEKAEVPKKSRRIDVDAEASAISAQLISSVDVGDYQFPSLDLLRSGDGSSVDARDEIMANKERLETAMDSFGIHAQIIDIIRGPTVTRYDIELPQGIKLARLTNLAGDLALSLGVINVRIAPIPDKISTVGIEVPNRIVSTVYLRDIIDSKNFSTAKSKLSFAIGKNISGDCVVGNISKLPHMLIAGTTGSGKSVCMNSLILSLLYKARPDEVKLIMIDPKMVELGVYNGIPHLYVPVVTDPKKAAGALQWSVVEMLKRYRLFSEIGVRDLDSYNRHCSSSGEPTMPRVVIVIDELADLMLVASKDVEESICRVAQMGRAAGMHLIIATQRPSADVITGLMKANIPSRIAFAVSSALESRIILDQAGAEKLVGMGDMLYSPVGIGKPMRIQGAFVSDEEREDVIQFIKEGSGTTENNTEIEQFMAKATEEKGGATGGKESSKEKQDDSDFMGGYDEMLPQAVEVVIETKSCSVSMLQRRIKLGYSRAARIVDQMEELGVVGPYEGAKPRRVLVDRDGWKAVCAEHGLAVSEDMALAADMDSSFDDSRL